MQSWLGWYHVTCWTYGQWLRGDPRGWRARHHREHCDGDYRNRPEPSGHADQLRLSRALLRRPPVAIDATLRPFVAEAVAVRLVEFGVTVMAAGMGAKHLHLLAKFPAFDARVKVGIAKQAATRALKDHCDSQGIGLGLASGDGIWAKRSRAEPVTGRRHQVAALYYVVRHLDDGAALWLAPELERKRDALIAAARRARRK